MVKPDDPDADFSKVASGISTSFGQLLLSLKNELVLLNSSGSEITRSAPLGAAPKNDTCASRPGTDITGGTRAGAPTTVDDEAACCDYCKATAACQNWIYGHPGDAEGNCWVMASITGSKPARARTLGGAGGGLELQFSTTAGAKFYGSGASRGDPLTSTSGDALVDNTIVYAPHYHTTDGYSVLAVVPETSTTGQGKSNVFPASWRADGAHASWSYPEGVPFELYLMPAGSLDAGTQAYYSLIGSPVLPPRYAFGFIASRWGWKDRSYIEDMLHQFRDGKYPIDAFIGDFGWFTNVSDYAFPPPGVANYHDFGYNVDTFPSPSEQLQQYRDDLHIRMGGIRKPRLGNTDLLNEARGKGYLLPGGERRRRRLANAWPTNTIGHISAEREPLQYADQRNINYSIPEARAWYAEHQKHYISEGVSFFWNDEGETDYFTFHYWNVAQSDSLARVDPTARFYSINRAWSPGMARLGATVWTGDINPSWEDLKSFPGVMLNWGLAGAPYVACDIGGFTGQTTAPLLTRWMQAGAYFPTMRVHSTKDATPHFPFLWDEPYQSAMRNALNRRMELVPYHYSLAAAMYQTGKLWVRPLAAEFPADEQASEITEQWMDGSLLVAPILAEDSTYSIYLPAGKWFHFGTAKVETGPTTLSGTADLTATPVFAPSGTIVTLAPVIQSTADLPGGPLEVHVYGGADAEFSLIEDDGETTDYMTATVRSTTFDWEESSRTLSWVVCRGAPSPQTMFTKLRLTLFSESGEPKTSDVVDISTSGEITI